jgi:dodecin
VFVFSPRRFAIRAEVPTVQEGPRYFPVILTGLVSRRDHSELPDDAASALTLIESAAGMLDRPAGVPRKEKPMATNQTYVKTEVVGSSNKSVSDAIESAIATASRSLRNLEWFEVVDVRGSVRDNKVANYQVTMKVGFRYEPKA